MSEFRGRTIAIRSMANILLVAVAAGAALLIWNSYSAVPWTRDGKVRVQVANIAPQVSGRIDGIRVSDNQSVHRGDVLYVIEAFDYEVALDVAKAEVKNREADLQVKRAQSARREKLSTDSTSIEEKQIYSGAANVADAALATAKAHVAQAEINLKRTEIFAPVDGYVTNLLMRVGDFAREGVSNISVVDQNSFWIDAYFEETKMRRVHVGDRIEARLMGYPERIEGRVESITRGISSSNAAVGTQGLPNVDPVYTWVRLAQRVPVHIHIDRTPSTIALVAGITATVTDTENPTAWPWLAKDRSNPHILTVEQ